MISLIEKYELFKKECKVINLDFEYQSCVQNTNGCLGDKRWAIITNLPENKLIESYSDLLKPYIPYILLTLEQGEVIKDYFANEDKYHKRQIRKEYMYGCDESIINYSHHQIKNSNFWVELEEQEIRKVVYELLIDALNSLTCLQRRRLIKHTVMGKSIREIADEEDVNYTKIVRSVKVAQKNIKEYFKKNGTILDEI